MFGNNRKKSKSYSIMPTKKERRKFVRFPTDLECAYCEFEETSQKEYTRLKDVSREGARMVANKSFAPGTLLVIEISIPGQSIPIISFNVAVWSRETDDAQYDVGMRISSMQNDDRARLLDYVYEEWLLHDKKMTAAITI